MLINNSNTQKNINLFAELRIQLESIEFKHICRLKNYCIIIRIAILSHYKVNWLRIHHAFRTSIEMRLNLYSSMGQLDKFNEPN